MSDIDWDRDEFSLTVGYALIRNLAVFGGYKTASTDFDGPNGSSDFSQDGPFIGAAYGLPVSNLELGKWFEGMLSFNVAVAFLDGEVNGVGGFELNGDTTGFTLGVKWNGRISGDTPLIKSVGGGYLSNGINYSLGIDGYNYEFEDDVSSSNDVTETILRFTVGLSVPFGL